MHLSSGIQSTVGHRFTNFGTSGIVTKRMGPFISGKEVRAIAYAFLWLCSLEGIEGTRKEDLERAAELAVERAAERAAERAVEKALESGNSTSETETIRESYSSVRKYDKSLRLPESGYTPAQRREYDRIMREREAAEKASAVLKRSIEHPPYDTSDESRLINVGQSGQSQRSYHENVMEGSPTSPRVFRHARPPPLPAADHHEATRSRADNLTDKRQRLPAKRPGANPVKAGLLDYPIRTRIAIE